MNEEKLFPETPDKISLVNSTGNERVDRILGGVIGIFERVFPNRIRSYYLTGSYANGTAVSTSDIDLHPIFKGGFKDETEETSADQIEALCDMISPIELGIHPQDERPVCHNGIFKLQCLLIFGEEIRAQMPLRPLEEFIRFSMDTSNQRKVRKLDEPMVFPLNYPNPSGEFYGYDQREMRSMDSYQGKGTKDLVGVIYGAAIAMVAKKTKGYVPSKSEAFRLYREFVNDEWTDFVTEVWDTCRMQWEYRIPEDETGQRRLRKLCEQTLAFENHYLTFYRVHCLEELRAVGNKYKHYAIGQLDDVVFPDDEVIEALKSVEDSRGWVMQAAKAVIEKIEKVRAVW